MQVDQKYAVSNGFGFTLTVPSKEMVLHQQGIVFMLQLELVIGKLHYEEGNT